MIDQPGFPGLHIRPPSGWLNDPNGLALIDGRYHVFFQYNPDQPLHRAIRWGHASSTDLIIWRYHPTALINRPGAIDEVGCWTGCVVDDHGVPTAVYTAVRDRAADAVVAIARSDRSLETWQQSDAGVQGPPADRRLTETRDPYVFSFGGHRYAVQGTGGPEADPAILLYGCDDLDRWSELGVLLDYSDPTVRRIAESTTWECPNLFPLGDHWVLVLSCDRRGELASVYLIGDLEPAGEGLVFVTRSGGLVDQSPAFYAPQVLVTDERVLIWGWAREIGRTDEDLLQAGWAGVLTFPRELAIDGDRLVSTPIPELDRLRSDALPAGAPITERSFELRADTGLRLELVDHDQHQVVVDEPGAVRMLVDGSLIEIFGQGETPRTVRAYPTDTSSWQVAGRVRINRLSQGAPVPGQG
jgi:beta-fructofuranosidase